jgi:hypothetical protein
MNLSHTKVAAAIVVIATIIVYPNVALFVAVFMACKWGVETLIAGKN